MRSPALPVLLLTLLLTAGCLQGLPSQEPDAGDGPPATDAPGGPGSPAASAGDALAELQGDGATPPRFAVRSTVHVTNATGHTETTTAHLLVDTDAQLVVSTLETDGASLSGAVAATTFHTARVDRTVVLGPPTSLAVYRNASLPPVDGLGALQAPDQAPRPGGLDDPAVLLRVLEDLPPEAHQATTPTAHEGRDAHRVHLAHTTDAGRIDANLTLDAGTARLLEVEGTTEGRVQGNGSRTTTTSFHLTFTYGDDATHPHTPAVRRAASMAFLTEEHLPGGSQHRPDAPERTWTIQPARDPGLVPLEEATAHVVNRTANGTETVLSLPLEQGSVEDGGVRLAYDDADDDGHVSPGDTLTLTRSGNATLEVHLEDEETGWRLVPGPGALLTLLGLVSAGLQRNRRRRA